MVYIITHAWRESMAGRSVVKTKQGKIEVDGKTLDVVCSLFADRVFLFISNLQKMGTLLDVCQTTVPAMSTHVFSVSTLLGLDTPEVHVFGRAIAGHLLLPPGHNLLLALGLREPSPHILPLLLPLLEDYKLWESAEPTPVT